MLQNDARTPRGTKHDMGERQCASTTQHGCKYEQRIPNFGPTGERIMTHAHPLNKLSKTLALQSACSFQTQADDRANSEPSAVSTEISLCTPDAWYDPNSVKVGYEIKFNLLRANGALHRQEIRDTPSDWACNAAGGFSALALRASA
jgi:hypothetical protein